MKKLFLGVLSLLCTICASADGGMWLPSLVSERIDDMAAKGFKLTAEDVYSINRASLKDAVVLFGGGCTGELISGSGLLITNHHCGYSHIQRHSSVEHDYLKDGFWSKSTAEELPCEGLSVSFLEYMREVTAEVLEGWEPGMDEASREDIVKVNGEKIVAAEKEAHPGLKVSVEPLFMGNQYFLFAYRVYTDVRLVGCPPSSIGKFGGDTDNWMWPRHTGDFSLFRVYAGADNLPADYSPDNVPFKPRKFFPISTAGVKEGDFTFIYGFPGSTQEYIHSAAVRYIAEKSDPAKIGLRSLRLDAQKKHMARSQKVRIQYSAKNASVANAWKKWQGEALGIRRNGVVDAKREYEKRLSAWAAGTRFEGICDSLERVYAELEPYKFALEIYNESAAVVEIARAAAAFVAEEDAAKREKALKAFYKDWYLPIDKESFEAVMTRFSELIAEDQRPSYFNESLQLYGSVNVWADSLFKSSAFASESKAFALSPEQAEQDPAYVFYKSMRDWAQEYAMPQIRRINRRLDLLNREYMQAQMSFEKDKNFFPDANLTLRVAYGNVKGYEPSDGVRYKPVSTLKGVMEKDNPEIFDYNIPQELRDLYASGDYSQVPVCFLATNHTTGGNSGSPVINAEGKLIGVNFDRVWEGTMSDIAFDPYFCRNIALDIRYALFIIKELGKADNIISELVLEP